MNIELKDKVALVSGAGRGIGRAIALKLADAGCSVICVSKNISSCSKVAEEILAKGGKAEAIAVDVAVAQEVKDLCANVLKKYDSVDILVNNAGITRDNLFMRMSDEEWESVISTNLSSCFYLTRGLIRAMMSSRWGRIVNISSISGQMGNAGQANYSAAKAGLIGLTKSIAREVAVRNIRRDGNDAFKKLAKTEVSEDEIKQLEEKLQKLTDKYIKDIDALVEDKSKEILTV